jgi:prevent-host-death family protein
MVRHVSANGNVWSISKAKANFAAFLRAAEKEPQIVTVRGVPKAVLLLKKNAKALGIRYPRLRKAGKL